MLLRYIMVLGLCLLTFQSIHADEGQIVNKEAEIDPIRDTISGEINSLIQDDVPRAYFSFTTKTFRDATPVDKFRDFVRTYAAYWNTSSIQWDNIVFYNDVGVVRAVFNSNGKTVNGTFFMKQENGVWKIMGMTMVPQTPVNGQQSEEGQ